MRQAREELQSSLHSWAQLIFFRVAVAVAAETCIVGYEEYGRSTHRNAALPPLFADASRGRLDKRKGLRPTNLHAAPWIDQGNAPARWPGLVTIVCERVDYHRRTCLLEPPGLAGSGHL